MTENFWGHPLSMYTKSSYVRVRIRGLEMLVFRKILRTYLMHGPFHQSKLLI